MRREGNKRISRSSELSVTIRYNVKRVSEWPAYTERTKNLHNVVSRKNGREISVCEIINLEQYRFAGRLGEGIGEAIPEI
jgi:hypothetical protein